MHSIVTLTLAPALDKSTSVPNMEAEKKLRCRIPKFNPGGGGVNVSRALQRLGTSSTAIFPVGGHSGKYYCDLLETEHIHFQGVPCKQSTRENFIVLDESSGNQFRFGMPAPELSKIEYQACLKAIKSLPQPEYLVISGSWPNSVPLDFMEEIANWTTFQNVKLVIDSSGDALKKAFELKTFLLKPNLGELASLTGKDWLAKDELVSLCRELMSRNLQQNIVISMGKEGAMLVTKKEYFLAVPPEVERKSTVGAGDSMVAGLLHGFAAGKPLAEILKYGIACGTAATLHPGTELCQPKDVQMILDRIQ